ncbi:sugar transferase [Cyclobacterium sp. SYSU L10401]|uniref:sugar transferase n=1 Tax=Cyclobacterium sp. SYSU L10401 TaxID=2678657 RepID=UPI0013D12B8F|nr:sugar transferase [Cyclobacterium sp. SYSU L10401]
MYIQFIKKTIDFFVAGIMLIMVLPFLLIIAILLFLFHGTVFFVHERPGKGEKVFKLIKFKTMNDKRDTQGKLLPDAQRLTKIGKIVRSTSFDELPQLWNVLKGDMSLIGPRPLLVQYLPLYSEKQRKRHQVRPGITGWAQVNGRNTISWKQKFEYDVWYVENLSLALDMKILWLTIVKVFKREGISAEGQATVEPFRGNDFE